VSLFHRRILPRRKRRGCRRYCWIGRLRPTAKLDRRLFFPSVSLSPCAHTLAEGLTLLPQLSGNDDQLLRRYYRLSRTGAARSPFCHEGRAIMWPIHGVPVLPCPAGWVCLIAKARRRVIGIPRH